MIFDAKSEYGLDLNSSIIVGDKESDMTAGISAGVGLKILYKKCSFEEIELIGENTYRVNSLWEILNLL